MSVASCTPSTENSTLATPTLSLALAVTETLPDTVAPAVGAVTDTVGGVVSEQEAVLAISVEALEVAPAVLLAVTASL